MFFFSFFYSTIRASELICVTKINKFSWMFFYIFEFKKFIKKTFLMTGALDLAPTIYVVYNIYIYIYIYIYNELF